MHNTLLVCDRDNFDKTTARSRNQTLVAKVEVTSETNRGKRID